MKTLSNGFLYAVALVWQFVKEQLGTLMNLVFAFSMNRLSALFLILLLTLTPGRLGAGEITLVRTFETWNGGIIMSTDPAGITYHPPSGHLFIADSEINEISEFVGDNIFETSLLGDAIFQEIASNHKVNSGGK